MSQFNKFNTNQLRSIHNSIQEVFMKENFGMGGPSRMGPMAMGGGMPPMPRRRPQSQSGMGDDSIPPSFSIGNPQMADRGGGMPSFGGDQEQDQGFGGGMPQRRSVGMMGGPPMPSFGGGQQGDGMPPMGGGFGGGMPQQRKSQMPQMGGYEDQDQGEEDQDQGFGGGMPPMGGMGGMGGGQQPPQQPKPPAMGNDFNFAAPQAQAAQPKKSTPTMFGDLSNPTDDARNQALANAASSAQQQGGQQGGPQGGPQGGGMPPMGNGQGGQDPSQMMNMMKQMMGGQQGGPQGGGMPQQRRRPPMGGGMGGGSNPFAGRPPMGGR